MQDRRRHTRCKTDGRKVSHTTGSRTDAVRARAREDNNQATPYNSRFVPRALGVFLGVGQQHPSMLSEHLVPRSRIGNPFNYNAAAIPPQRHGVNGVTMWIADVFEMSCECSTKMGCVGPVYSPVVQRRAIEQADLPDAWTTRISPAGDIWPPT